MTDDEADRLIEDFLDRLPVIVGYLTEAEAEELDRFQDALLPDPAGEPAVRVLADAAIARGHWSTWHDLSPVLDRLDAAGRRRDLALIGATRAILARKGLDLDSLVPEEVRN